MEQLEKIQTMLDVEKPMKAELYSMKTPVNAVISRQETPMELARSSFFDGFIASLIGVVVVGIGSDMGSDMGKWFQDPLAIPVFGAIGYAMSYLGLYFSNQNEYIKNITGELGITDKSEKRQFIKQLSSLSKGESFRRERVVDNEGTVETWTIQKQCRAFRSFKNTGSEWDGLLNDTVAVYGLRKTAEV